MATWLEAGLWGLLSGGALVYSVGNWGLARLGALLDGVPESIAIGLTMLGDGAVSVATVVGSG